MSLYIGTGSHGPALLDNPINTKPSDVVLFMRAVKAQTTMSTGKTRRSLRCFKISYKYQISRFFFISFMRGMNVLARLYIITGLSKLS